MGLLNQLYQINVITDKGKINPNSSRILSHYPDINKSLDQAIPTITTDQPKAISRIVYCLQNNLSREPSCEYCKGPVKFLAEKRYQRFCSRKCNMLYQQNNTIDHQQRVAKMTSTNRQIYGYDFPLQNPSTYEQTRTTHELIHGHRYAGSVPDIRQKQQATTLQRYGYQCSLLNQHIASKALQTRRQRFGTDYKHQQHIPEQSLAYLSDHKWMYTQHITNQQTLAQIAQYLGVATATVHKRMHQHGITPIRFQASRGQKELCDFIKSLGFEIQTNNRSIIPPKELDIVVPAKSLAIEYNGCFWHTDLMGKGKKYHVSKTDACINQNINLIHVWEYEWIYKHKQVMDRLKSKLGCGNAIGARKCTLNTINTTTARNFLQEHHIDGFVPCSEYYGLYFQQQLVAACGFSKARYDTNEQTDELVRYASRDAITVCGGVSKFVKEHIDRTGCTTIVSYCDRRWNTGSGYSSAGFTYKHTTQPSYYYIKPGSLLPESRIKYQKHKLENKLKIFDPKLTEWENMVNNGYDRIWDCGNIKFVYEE